MEKLSKRTNCFSQAPVPIYSELNAMRFLAVRAFSYSQKVTIKLLKVQLNMLKINK